MLDQLQKALDGLIPLVDRVAQSDHSNEELRTEILRWESEYAEGRGGLAELAIAALHYQIAGEGVSGSIEENAAREQALRRLEVALFPAAVMGIVEADPAPEFKQRFPSARGFRIGEAQIIAEPTGEGWHVSVSHRDRYPTVEELRGAASLTEGVDTMWIPLPVPGSQGQRPNKVIHLFEIPPGYSPNSVE